MNIDIFYRAVHLVITIITVLLMLYIWFRYQQIKKAMALQEPPDYGLLLYCAGLIIWEFNIYDSDMKFEAFSTIIVDVFLLSGTLFINPNFFIFRNPKIRERWLGITLSVAAALILFCQILFSLYDNYIYGYSISQIFTGFTCFVLSISLFQYFKARQLTGMGVITCLLFLVLFTSLVASLFTSALGNWMNVSEKELFAWIKLSYLATSFGLFSVLIAVSFNWFNDLSHRLYLSIYTNEDKPVQKESSNELKNKIYGLIKIDKLEEAIEELLSYHQNKNKSIHTVLMTANQLNRLGTEKIRGIISDEDYSLTRNKIAMNLINLSQMI